MKRRRRRSREKHHWGDLDRESPTATGRRILSPTSTYIPSNHVEHLRFELNVTQPFYRSLSPPFFPCLFWFGSVVLFVMQVHDWPVGPLGLLYDRGWMVVNRNGVCLSQKREARLCLIRPQVHLPSNKLLLQASGQQLSENKYTANQKKFQSVGLSVRNSLYYGIYVLPLPCRNGYHFSSLGKQCSNVQKLSGVSE